MSVANSYARALYEAAKESKISGDQLIQIENQLDQIVNVLNQSHEARVALLAPLTTASEKKNLINEFSKLLKLSPVVTQFLALLARKGRLNLLSEMREAFGAVRLTMEGGVPGTLVSAEPMNESDVNSLATAFGKKLGKKVTFRVSADSSLLAGMKVTVNGVTYDGTLRSQLLKLRDYFVAGVPGAHA